MGEVYRARDLKLQREVALKVLPDAVARESHVLAALNHPRLAGVYGVAEEQSVTALVLLVEGPWTVVGFMQDARSTRLTWTPPPVRTA